MIRTEGYRDELLLLESSPIVLGRWVIWISSTITYFIAGVVLMNFMKNLLINSHHYPSVGKPFFTWLENHILIT